MLRLGKKSKRIRPHANAHRHLTATIPGKEKCRRKHGRRRCGRGRWGCSHRGDCRGQEKRQEGRPDWLLPGAPSGACAAALRTNRRMRNESSGRKSRPTSTCRNAISTTATSLPAWKARGTLSNNFAIRFNYSHFKWRL